MADPDSQEASTSRSPTASSIDAATGAPVAERARQRRSRAPQQPPAPRRRGRARRPDAARRPIPTSASQAAQSVFKTHDDAMLPAARQRARQGDRHERQAGASSRRARRSCCSRPTPPRREKLDAIADHQGARRPGRAGAADRRAGRTRRRRSRRPRRQRDRGDPAAARAVVDACRTPGTACRSARCCCWPRSGSPSPSA